MDQNASTPQNPEAPAPTTPTLAPPANAPTGTAPAPSTTPGPSTPAKPAKASPLSDTPRWTEAPAIAWTEVWSRTGAKINLTSRADNLVVALDNLNLAVDYAKTKYGLTTSRPAAGDSLPPAPSAPSIPTAPQAPQVPTNVAQAYQTAPGLLPQGQAPAQAPQPLAPAVPPQPQYVPVEGSNPPAATEEIQVAKIKHVVTDNGKHLLRVFGGKYVKYGLVCWPEKMPAGFILDGLQVGIEYAPTPTMKFATTNGKNIISFRA